MPSDEWPDIGARSRARFVLRGRLASVVRGGGRGGGSGAPGEAGGSGVARAAAFRADQSLRHVAETIGIPACEIGAASVDGEPWSLELPPPDGSTVALDPVPEPVDLGREPKFLADGHLGRLSRVLRLLGFDSLWRRDADRELRIEIALGEDRVLLSRDRALLFGRPLSRPAADAPEGAAAWRRGMLILSSDPYRQLVEVCSRFALDRRWKPLSLCSSCGAAIRAVPKAEVLPFLPSIVARRYDEFSRCPDCGKVYWKGDHARSIEPLLSRLRSDLARR